MYNHLLFLLYWLINIIVIYTLSLIFPSSIILGNHRLIAFEASVYSGFWLTFFVWTMWDFVVFRGVKLEPAPLGFIYFLTVNVLGIWIVSRYSQYTGIGITSYAWAIVIGLVANTFQRLVWKMLVDKNKIY